MKVPGKDFRIVNYCRNIECPEVVDDLNVSCLEQCLPNTTVEDVYVIFNEMSTTEEFETCQDQCEGVPVDTKEDYDCKLDCYNEINPHKFLLATATEVEFIELETLDGGPE